MFSYKDRAFGFEVSPVPFVPNTLASTLSIMSSAESNNSYYSAMVAPSTPQSDSVLVQAAFVQSADSEARIALLEFQVSELTQASRQLSGGAVCFSPLILIISNTLILVLLALYYDRCPST